VNKKEIKVEEVKLPFCNPTTNQVVFAKDSEEAQKLLSQLNKSNE
jgi:hypothetical protein